MSSRTRVSSFEAMIQGVGCREHGDGVATRQMGRGPTTDYRIMGNFVILNGRRECIG